MSNNNRDNERGSQRLPNTAEANLARNTVPETAPTRQAEMRREPNIIAMLEKGDLYIPPELIPRGMRYEWKAETVMGQPIPSLSLNLRMGWAPVPSDRHPELGAPLMKGREPDPLIRRGGLILCERSEELCRRVEDYFKNETAAQTHAKQQELGVSNDPRFPRMAPQIRDTGRENFSERPQRGTFPE